MSFGAHGLTELTLEELQELLRVLHHERLLYPIRMSDLIGNGFPHVAEKAEILQGLDERGLRVLLVSVIAERKAAPRSRE